jgi:hypothetical protein
LISRFLRSENFTSSWENQSGILLPGMLRLRIFLKQTYNNNEKERKKKVRGKTLLL